MRFRTLVLGSILALGAGLTAQTQTVIYNDGSSPTSGGGNAFPFGSEGIRYQSLMTASQMGAKAGFINDILIGGYSVYPNIAIGYGDIEIRMGMTSATSLTTSWSTNNPKPTTVYRGPLRANMSYGKWVGIGLPVPYLYIPSSTTPNLCIEVIVWKVDDKGGYSTGSNFYYPQASGNVQRAFRYQWTTNQTQAPLTGSSGCRWGLVFNDGNYTYAGYGCPGSNSKTPTTGTSSSGWPQLGVQFPITVTNAPASAPAFLFIGGDFAKFAGVVPLPFDLAPFGAPKCMVWNDHLLAIGTGTDSSGAAKIPLLAPNTLPSHVRIYGYWWCLDKQANKLGFAMSDQSKLIY